MGNITNRHLLEEIRKVEAILIGDGTVESMEKCVQHRLMNVELGLKKHLEDCAQRPKDDNGKFLERRNGWYKWKKRAPVIALVISLLTFVGGWSACEYFEGKLHTWFIEYTEHIRQSE